MLKDVFQNPIYEVLSARTRNDVPPVLLLIKDAKSNAEIEIHLSHDDAKGIANLLLEAVPS